MAALAAGTTAASFMLSTTSLPRRHYGAAYHLLPAALTERQQQQQRRLCRYLTRSSSVSPKDCRQTPEETQMTQDALDIVKAAIQAVDPYTAIRNHLSVQRDGNSLIIAAGGQSKLQRFPLEDFDEILLVAFGKATSAMATATLEIFQDHNVETPLSGVVICKDDHASNHERDTLASHHVRLREASHPVPDPRSQTAAQEIMDLIQAKASPRTLVICCISGGGSSLFCLPAPALTMQDLQETNRALLESGLAITDMNVIRKRLEQGKGGRLAMAAFPSTVLTLVLSDVLGDPLDQIACGPTVQDSTTAKQAWDMAQSLKLPNAVMKVLEQAKNAEEATEEDLRNKGMFDDKCSTVLVGNNELSVLAAANKAQRLGYHPVVLGARIEGEAKYIAGMYVAMAEYLSDQKPNAVATLPAAVIAGGETTVTMSSAACGKGGRNQELALTAATQLHSLGIRNVVLASVGTDGTDGPTDAAGAVIDGGTVKRLRGSPHDALARHDSYTYLDQFDAEGQSPLIKTGPTGTNVADVCVVLVQPPPSLSR